MRRQVRPRRSLAATLKAAGQRLRVSSTDVHLEGGDQAVSTARRAALDKAAGNGDCTNAAIKVPALKSAAADAFIDAETCELESHQSRVRGARLRPRRHRSRLRPATPVACGDGDLDPGEGCDDGDTRCGDGCGTTCSVEPGWTCAGEPSTCTAVCGDGLIRDGETCDDGGTAAGDGCADDVQRRGGLLCAGEPSVCSCGGDEAGGGDVDVLATPARGCVRLVTC
jgi:cysteine-rich repeat protein